MNPYLFVVGSPRSGTTLLQRMLDHHPLLAVANDTHFITKGMKCRESGVGSRESEPSSTFSSSTPSPSHPTDFRRIRGGFPDGGVEPGISRLPPPEASASRLPVFPTEGSDLTPEIVEKVRTYRRFHRLGLSDEAVCRAAEGAGTYSEFVGALYAEFAAMRGKPFGGEKTPDYLTELPALHALFPRAKFIHIVRDGRDVALSAMKWANEEKGPGKLEHWREEPVAVCALWWRRQIMAATRAGKDLGPEAYHEVRYEDLVAAPDERLREISTFLDLPHSETMANFHEGKTKPGEDAKKAWLPPTKGLRDWRKDMPRRDAALFDALAGDVLSELGYERSAESFPPEVEGTAARLREWWENAETRRRRPRTIREGGT